MAFLNGMAGRLLFIPGVESERRSSDLSHQFGDVLTAASTAGWISLLHLWQHDEAANQ